MGGLWVLPIAILVAQVWVACLFILIYKLLKRMEGTMVTKAELEQQIDQVGQIISDGFEALGAAVAKEFDEVQQAIANGNDLTSVSEKVASLRTAFEGGIAAMKSQVDAIIPSSEPEPEPGA